jgi:prepilin peptidase CpaA
LPNWITLGGAAAALTLRLGYGGLPLFLNGFVAACGAGALLLLPFLMHGAGGGDVKMLFAAGAIAGSGRFLDMLIITSVAGVVMGVAMLVLGKLDGARLKHLWRALVDWRYDRKAAAARLPPKDSEKVRIPFSIPIAAGLIFAIVCS